MNCEKFESRLHHLLDRRVRPENDPALLAHAGVCFECNRVMSAQQALWDGLDLLEIPEPSAGFEERILAEVGKSRRQRTWGWVWGIVTAAAVLLVSLVPVLRMIQGNSAESGMPVATDGATSDPENTTGTPDSANTQINGELATADSETEIDLTFGVIPRLSEQLTEVSVPDLNSQDIPGFGPISSSFSSALGIIRRTLPGRKQPPETKPQAGAFRDAWPRAIS